MRQKLIILADALTNQGAGVHIYTASIIRELYQNPPADLEIFCILEKPHPLVPKPAQLIMPDKTGIPGYTTYRHFYKIPQLIKKLQPDYLWQPAQFGPIFPPQQPTCITTVHDLTPLTHPQCHPWLSRTLQKVFLRRILAQTDLIIAPSQATKTSINNWAPQLTSRTHTVALAPNRELLDSQPSPTALAKLKISGPFLLTVGTQEPRKNQQLLINAFAHLQKDFPDLQLVIAGGPGWRYQLDKQAQDLLANKKLIMPGYVPNNILKTLYQECKLFVYPSAYEGFGLPVCEAMALGAACLISQKGSLPEVGGDAVDYIPELNIGAMVQAIENLLTAPQKITQLKKAALAASQQWSWEKHIRKVIGLLTE